MLFPEAEIECPNCGKKQIKQIRVREIQDEWSIGDVYRCEAVGGHDTNAGCGKRLVVNVRTQLFTKACTFEDL